MSDIEQEELRTAVPPAREFADLRKVRPAAEKIDRKLAATASDDATSYADDVKAIAKIARKHFGDLAPEVLRLASEESKK